MLRFEAADKLHWEIMRCLRKCGGRYRLEGGRWGEVQRNVIRSIATDRFIIHRDGEEITSFACYEMFGTSMFVLECGCLRRADMAAIRRALRAKEPQMQGVSWYRYGKGDRFFPHQRGR